MPHYFDEFGILSADPIPGRSTDVAPPDTALPPGHVWRWEGYNWGPFDPSPPPVEPVMVDTRITPPAFKRRLTQDERIAIRNLARVNDVVFDFMDTLGDAHPIKLDDPGVVTAIQFLEAQGAVGAGRGSVILSLQIEESERP